MSPRQVELAEKFGSGEAEDWYDWRWHVRNRIQDVDRFCAALGIDLPADKRRALERTVARFPLAVTPYYASLIDPDDHENDPICRQCFPSVEELNVWRCDNSDPLAEDKHSPVPGITHRYPDRVLFHVSNVCSLYCRHCTRKRKVGDVDRIPSRNELRDGIEYIRRTPAVRDVLLSGGDPLMLSDDMLDGILSELRRIPHVEIVRIGSRMPVTLPYRVTDRLVEMLKKHHPLWLNTQFNHPRELTRSSQWALAKLADAGIPLGNQSVLLAGVNDCPRIIKTLVQKLVRHRVRPYYIYQCDLSEGLGHFRTPIGKGIEIIENLIGHTSGFARPVYVVDAPGGGGKIPIQPNYIVSWSTNKVVLRNYEGVLCTYKEPDSYEPWFCDRNCRECQLQLKVEEASEERALGVSKLLADYSKATTLVPEGTQRPGEGNSGRAGSAGDPGGV
ncbi:MAG: lysine 2,3-aminomutase [Elusimicrobiota bacterium]